ncbi:hypothetical protein Plhal710r2_c046g0149151 [Plasmopara halstedii]
MTFVEPLPFNIGNLSSKGARLPSKSLSNIHQMSRSSTNENFIISSDCQKAVATMATSDHAPEFQFLKELMDLPFSQHCTLNTWLIR